MKLSIWQQFSSNHSADYRIVGEFDDAVKAEQAAERILQILRQIQQWYLDHDEHPADQKQPTPYEKQAADEYGFDWKQTLDWARYDVNSAIRTFDRLVIVTTYDVETWQTGHQFVNLLRAMNANVGQSVMDGIGPDGEKDIYLGMVFQIDCEATSETAASQIATDIQKIFDDNIGRTWGSFLPWIVYHPNVEGTEYAGDKIFQIWQDYAEDSDKQMEAIQRNPNNQQKWNIVRKLPFEVSEWYRRLESDVDIRSRTAISVNGTHLSITDVYPSNIPIGFECFFKYLRQLGCSQITYKVVQLD